ncbi:hypothetical protein FQN50_005623 [Emmonsiellopsis sp. PD_5]|nr:hypothetical protein FQN50_005623 [Emmonsiellopsis sp. PD_5]
MGRRISRRIWIGDRYEGHIFYVQKDDIKWRIGKKLSERSYFIPKYSDQGKTTAWTEAQAVFPCEQVYGPSVGAQAILKVRMQIPPEEYPSLDPAVRARHATTDYSPRAQGEVNSLAYFKNNGCSVTPRLLSTAVESQPINDPSMPVPGGYIFSILMERVPGVPLGDFWTYDPEKREKIRNSFRKGMM